MATLPVITKDMLPDGWALHPLDHPGTVVLKAPRDRGFVTIHLRARAWAFGVPKDRLRLKREPCHKPKGRGWLQQLVKEATTEFLASSSRKTIRITLPPIKPRTPEEKDQDDRMADLHLAFQQGVDTARGDQTARASFDHAFAGDTEALEEFNRGLAEDRRKLTKS